MSMVLWPVVVCILVVWPLSTGEMVRMARWRRGMAGLGAAHYCDYILYGEVEGLYGVRDCGARDCGAGREGKELLRWQVD